MANSLLIPLSVTAKVIQRETTVPVLAGGAPFNRGAKLEAGIHIHWALPDALTKSKLIPSGSGEDRALFPGVPDLWLVVRFNPAPKSIGRGAKRSWRAWVVDARMERATPFEDWKLPTKGDADSIHTLAGMLPSAQRIGHPGWGIFKASEKAFDPGVAAYYPACRTRFGFHDDLRDLSRAAEAGHVSYTVVGWYSIHAHDPLFNAPHRRALLESWKVAHHHRAKSFTELGALVKFDATSNAPAWTDAKLKISDAPAPTEQEIAALRHAAERAGSLDAQRQRLKTMQASFPAADDRAAGALPEQSIARASVHDSGAKETICHGSVVEVPLAGSSTAGAPINGEDVRLFPSIKRALAEIASKQTGEQENDFVEMLLQDVDAQKGTLGGVLDYAGGVHALSFQSVPGKSRFYARLDIHPKKLLTDISAHLAVGVLASNAGRVATGHWPKIATRAAALSEPSGLDSAPPDVVFDPGPPAPQEPTQAEIDAWIAQVTNAFNTVLAVAPIDARLLHVHDFRPNAQPAALGRSTDGHGPAQASWWLDIQDTAALKEIFRSLKGAQVHLPDAAHLYELPGPRWYRPWAPALMLFGAGRSYRAGFDGRFTDDGFLQTRFGGETMHALAIGGSAPVSGRQILEKGEAFSATAGVPAEAASLLEEALLLDTESAPFFSAANGERAAAGHYRSAVRGLWLSRDPRLTATERDALKALLPLGDLMSPVGVSPWRDPRDPLFVDVNYSHPHSPIASDWELKPDYVEMTAKSPAATVPPAGQVEVFDERAYVTASVPKALESALVTKRTLDMRGRPVRAKRPPAGIGADTFLKMDALAAPLTKFDETLFARGHRQRAGALRINKLDLIDTFGLHRSWNSGADPASPAGGPSLSWWTELSPRLPYWGRLRFRLQSAADPEQEASPIDPTIIGVLLPDFVEHALEVFDGEGKAIGQLSSDPPQFGSTDAKTLQVTFTVHPWLGFTGADPLDAIAHPRLRELVAALVAQSRAVPGNAPGFFETGLTGLLRVIDTVRATLDPSVKSPDRKVHLLGEPIVVMLARLTLEGTPSNSPSDLAQTPPPLNAPPALPTVPVRIGDITRPDDSVLGVFIPAPNPADARFAPVSKLAAEHAIINALIHPAGSFDGVPVEHPFIKDQVAEFTMTVAEQRDFLILADVRGGLYATCGALPRKKIIIPPEFLSAALRHLEPTFPTGPVMAMRTMGALKAAIPPPNIEGYTTGFVHDESGAPVPFPESPVPPVPPLAELPVERALLTEGWLRLKPEEE
jgi:hypothetical protein